MKVQSVLLRHKGKPRRQRFFIVGLSLLAVLLSACSFFPTAQQSGTPVTGPVEGSSPTAASSSPAAQSSPQPTINLQVVSCPASVGAIKWDSVVGTKAGVDKVQKVTCAPLEDGGLAALINVRYYSPNQRLDVSVYDNLFGTPARRFGVQGLIQGNTSISPTETIMTAENPDSNPLGPDTFKEYQWNGSAFAQIFFPGIFPDVTHYQAEQDQANVNALAAQSTSSRNIWQNSAFSVVNRMAQYIFHWPPANVKNSVITYSSRANVYLIRADNYGPGGGGFISSLFHLDNVGTNIFEVKQVTSVDGLALLNRPASDTQVSSPIHVSASYRSAGTLLGRAVVLTDTYVTIGDGGALHGSALTGYATFAPVVSYHLSTGGAQEGLVLFYFSNQNNVSLSNQVLVAKLLLVA